MVDFVALLQRLAELSKPLVGQGTLGLEPHVLHLIEIFHRRYALLEMQMNKFMKRN